MRKLIVHFFLFALLFLGISVSTPAGVRVVVAFAPPPLPVYVQPACPGDGYIWVPGYWAWDDGIDDYYWVPGTWILAPEAGYLWTPGYWGWDGDGYVFYDGYWGATVGFYGGIDYGFGYFGVGYVGGRWDGDRFFYNREVSNVNVTVVHNVYKQSVTNVTVNHISYNGGSGGITARATAQEDAAAHQHHLAPVAAQSQQVQAARENSDLRASVNHGKPSVAATPRPGEFEGHGVEHAKSAGAPYHPPERPANAGANGNARVESSQPHSEPVHAGDLPPIGHPAAPNTGNPKLDQKYEKQQQKLVAQQEKARQKLQQQQTKQDQKLAKQNANEQRKQQMEQKHQQQTQHLAQRQSQQVQHMQQRQQPSRPPQPHKPPHQ